MSLDALEKRCVCSAFGWASELIVTMKVACVSFCHKRKCYTTKWLTAYELIFFFFLSYNRHAALYVSGVKHSDSQRLKLVLHV